MLRCVNNVVLLYCVNVTLLDMTSLDMTLLHMTLLNFIPYSMAQSTYSTVDDGQAIELNRIVKE